jgi:hypothetical protein
MLFLGHDYPRLMRYGKRSALSGEKVVGNAIDKPGD